MEVNTGRMNSLSRKGHHPGWFRLFRGRHIIEVWLGDRWVFVRR